MIIIRFIGGLGNQLFQYAFYKQLELRFPQIEVKADISEFENYYLHNGFELERVFDLKLDKATQKEINKLKTGRSFFDKVRRKISGYKHTHIFQQQFDYSFVIKDNLYLDGYWQHLSFWKNNVINPTDYLHFRIPPSAKNKKLIEELKNCNSVSIHIRRGDYLLPENAKVYVNCSIDYYQRAISYFERKYPEINFYVFSNDIPWVKKSLRTNSPIEFIAHNTGINSFEDLRLMAQCKHNIIANSSFSWWGAYLNTSPNKEVVCPDLWWKDPNRKDDIYIPKTWKKIKHD